MHFRPYFYGFRLHLDLRRAPKCYIFRENFVEGLRKFFGSFAEVLRKIRESVLRKRQKRDPLGLSPAGRCICML